MDIASYISDLLRKHGEISVSGLGTFYKKRIDSHYDDQQGNFLPPACRIDYKSEFNSSSLLAEYISEQKHISLTSSEHFIEKFAEDVKKQLNTEQTAEIHPLGILHKTGEEYSFIASDNSWPDTSLFGLKPVKEIGKGKISDPNWDPVILTEAPALIEAEEEAEQEPETVEKRKFPVLLLILVLLLSGLAAVYFFAPNTFNYFTQKPVKPAKVKIAAPVEKPETLTDSIMVADSIIQSLNKQGFEVDKPRDTLKVSTQANPVNTGITYEVIGASLNSEKDAESITKNFRAKGIDARIIHAKDKKRNNILISLGSFTNKESAGTELIRIKNDIEPGAYIYTYNNK